MLLFGYLYVYLFIPETKGLSLEEVSSCAFFRVIGCSFRGSLRTHFLCQVDELYRSGVKPWNSAEWKPAATHERDEEKDVRRDSPDKE